MGAKWDKFKNSLFDVKTLLSTASLATAGTSLALNRRNMKENAEYRKRSEDELARSREQNAELLKTLKDLNHNLKDKKLISHNYNYYVPKESIPKDESLKPKQVTARKKFLGLFSNNTNMYNQRNYSIQTGSYIGEKDYKNWKGNSSTQKSKANTGVAARIGGAAAGAIVSNSLWGGVSGYVTGMILSSVFNALRTAAEKSVFNKSVTTGLVPEDLLKIVENYYKESNTKVDPVGKVYDVDKSASNYTVSILSKGSVFAILVYRPSKLELRQLNKVLDDYCKKYKNADYASENVEPKEDSYIVELNVIKGTEKDFIKSLIETGIKFNIITKDTNLKNGMKSEQKGFSFGTDFLDNSFKGASIGGALGGLATPFIVKAKNAAEPSRWEWAKGAAKGAVGGIIVGAALGTLFGIIKNEATSRNRDNTINNRYLPKVTEMLLNCGFLEDKDFTRDPKTADDLRTRICIMVSRYSTDTRISINCSADFKTQQLIDKMINDLSLSRRVSIKKQGSDRFANIEMLKRTKIDEDVNLIKSISEYLMKKHIPIYLVEVG